jgi:hypothetical protein
MKIIITEDQFEKLNDNGGLDYIDTHWDKYKGIGHNIRKNLPNVTTGNEREVGIHLRTKPYSELESNWNIKDLVGISSNLDALSEKITHMMYTGKGDSIKPMLQSIVNNGIKTQYRFKNKKGNSELERGSLGKGHFRWNWRAYTLNDREIKRLKEFFNL